MARTTSGFAAQWCRNGGDAPREELGVFEGLMQPTHLIIILAIVLIVFGPGKLPGIGGALGKGIREFKDSVTDGEKAEQPVVQAAEVDSENA